MEKISEHQVFRYNEDVSVNSLDPVYIKSQSEIWIGSQIYEGLVSLDSSLKPIPQLAKYWKIEDSGHVYKFIIREGIPFIQTDISKNGDPIIQKNLLRIQDIAYSFYRLLDPKTASPGAWIFNDKMAIPEALKSSRNSNYSELYYDTLNPIFIVNDSTIGLRLLRPFPAFLSLLATNFAWIVPESANTLSQHAVGTGPFFLRRWEGEVKMVLLKNPHYYEFENQQRLPFLEAVNIHFVKSKQTAFMQFMANQYDFFNGVDASFIDELLTQDAELNPKYQSKINALISDFLNTEYIGFYLGDSLNGKLNPYKDKNLRKALQSSIDKKALIKYQRNGLGRPGDRGFVPPVLWSTSTVKEVPPSSDMPYPDFNKARKYWKQSDFKSNPNRYAPLVLTTTADYLDMAVFLQNAWKQIGITVAIDIQTGGMLRQLRNSGKLGMFRGSWIADYPDPENYLACFYGPYKAPNGPNYTHFMDMKFDRLFESLAFADIGSTEGIQQRENWAIQANAITEEEAPIIVLYYDKSVRLSQKCVKGLKNDPINRLDLKRVRKVKN